MQEEKVSKRDREQERKRDRREKEVRIRRRPPIVHPEFEILPSFPEAEKAGVLAVWQREGAARQREGQEKVQERRAIGEISRAVNSA